MLISKPIFPKPILICRRCWCFHLGDLCFNDFMENSWTFIESDIVFNIKRSNKCAFKNDILIKIITFQPKPCLS